VKPGELQALCSRLMIAAEVYPRAGNDLRTAASIIAAVARDPEVHIRVSVKMGKASAEISTASH
jgi:hypothetical protein